MAYCFYMMGKIHGVSYLSLMYSWDKIVTEWFSYVVSDLRNPQVLLRHEAEGFRKS